MHIKDAAKDVYWSLICCICNAANGRPGMLGLASAGSAQGYLRHIIKLILIDDYELLPSLNLCFNYVCRCQRHGQSMRFPSGSWLRSNAFKFISFKLC